MNYAGCKLLLILLNSSPQLTVQNLYRAIFIIIFLPKKMMIIMVFFSSKSGRFWCELWLNIKQPLSSDPLHNLNLFAAALLFPVAFKKQSQLAQI